MTEVVFVHERYPFGGGETVTALVAKGLTDADSDVHVTVIAAHLDRKQAADTAGVTHMQAPLTADSIVARLGGIGPEGVLIVPVDPPRGLLESVRSQLPGWKTVFILHSEPMWQVRGKTALSPVKAMRERLFKAYTRRYTRRYREIYAQVYRFCVLCDGYRLPLARIVGDESKIRVMYNPVALSESIPLSGKTVSDPLPDIDNIYDIKSMKNNKIAFLLPSYVGGGAEKVTDRIVSELKAEYDLDALLISASFTPESMAAAVEAGYTVETLDKPDGHYYSDATTDEVIDILRRHDVTMLVMTVDMLKDVGRIRKAIPGISLIYHLHGRPLWEVSAKLVGSRRDVEKSGSRAKLAEWYLTKYAKEKLLGLYTHRYRRHYRQMYAGVDRFVVLCEGYRREVERIVGAGAADSRVVAMYNPLPSAAGNGDCMGSHGKTVLYVGRLSYNDKRVDRLLRIWAMVSVEHPDWTLKIVGDGPERASLEDMAVRLGITDTVKFCGYTADPSPYYAEASILCLTSEFEGWPLVLVEAQAAGVWPVAFGCSAGIRELIGDGGTRGSVVTPYSENEYAATLSGLMSDPERIAALRPAMIESTHRYAPEVIAGKWKDLFEEIESDK